MYLALEEKKEKCTAIRIELEASAQLEITTYMTVKDVAGKIYYALAQDAFSGRLHWRVCIAWIPAGMAQACLIIWSTFPLVDTTQRLNFQTA